MIHPNGKNRNPRKARQSFGIGPHPSAAEQLLELQCSLVYVLVAPKADQRDLLDEADRLTKTFLVGRCVTDLTRSYLHARVLSLLCAEFYHSFDGPPDPTFEQRLEALSASVDEIDDLLVTSYAS